MSATAEAAVPHAVPSGRAVSGRIAVPSSKSVTHRCLTLALLAGRQSGPGPQSGPVIVERPLLAEDTRLFLAALGRCGFAVEEREGEVRLTAGEPPQGEVEIFCGNAGTMLRLLVAALAAVPGTWRLDGTPRLRERPVGPLADALRQLGTRIEWLGREGSPPLRIAGGTLGAGTVQLDAGESSQYLSALLMAALRAPGPVTVEVAALTSAPYVDVTLACVERAGGRIERLGSGAFRVEPGPLTLGRLRVEGDWSAAGYPAAAAALTGGTVTLEGLRRDSRQGDRAFLDLLAAMGAEIAWSGGAEETVTVRGRAVAGLPGAGHLAGITADLSAMPDQVPTLAALAPFAAGVTRIDNVAHLRIKESDRLAAMAQELRRLGAEVEEGPDFLEIPGIWAAGDSGPTPPVPTSPVTVETHNDHRIAMSLALTALRRPGTRIAAPEVVGKSYPGFWRDLQSLLAG